MRIVLSPSLLRTLYTVQQSIYCKILQIVVQSYLIYMLTYSTALQQLYSYLASIIISLLYNLCYSTLNTCKPPDQCRPVVPSIEVSLSNSMMQVYRIYRPSSNNS